MICRVAFFTWEIISYACRFRTNEKVHFTNIVGALLPDGASSLVIAFRFPQRKENPGDDQDYVEGRHR